MFGAWLSYRWLPILRRTSPRSHCELTASAASWPLDRHALTDNWTSCSQSAPAYKHTLDRLSLTDLFRQAHRLSKCHCNVMNHVHLLCSKTMIKRLAGSVQLEEWVHSASRNRHSCLPKSDRFPSSNRPWGPDPNPEPGNQTLFFS